MSTQISDRTMRRGEVAKKNPSLLYTQTMNHGSLSRDGRWLVMMGRRTSTMPLMMSTSPSKVKGSL